jgi:ABC-type antimicrobial peptide transport system permease subunit
MRRFVQVRGVEEPEVSGAVHDLSLLDGGDWFGAAGVQMVPGKEGDEAYIQCVLGEGLARELGQDTDRPGKTGFFPWVLELFGKPREKPPLQVGDTFELGPRRWVVVGIMKSGGKTFDSEVWAKRKLVGEMLRKDTRTTAVLRVKDGLDPAAVAKELTANFKSPAIMAKTESDYFESLNESNRMFLYAIIFVTVIMGIGGIFGIINTMFAAIAQRTRDIGVLRILGFARWQILLSFFLESLLLAVIGGAIGCGLGWLADGVSATSQMNSGTGGGKSVMLKLVVDARILGAGMGFALVMGCVGGLLPSLSAVRMKLLDSLR